MSCTDDKTACPCEPTPAFTAEDVKNYVLGLGDSNYKWDAIESGMYVPNENYNPEHGAEMRRLHEAWSMHRDYSIGGQTARSQAYQAYVDYVAAHTSSVREEKNVPFAFKHDGVEYPVTIVENDGGGEGHGEYCHMIYEIDGRYFKLEGSYYSYDGMYWDDDSFREVKAAKKEVTVYE